MIFAAKRINRSLENASDMFSGKFRSEDAVNLKATALLEFLCSCAALIEMKKIQALSMVFPIYLGVNCGITSLTNDGCLSGIGRNIKQRRIAIQQPKTFP